MQLLEQLNRQFGIKDQLRLEQIDSGFVMIKIDNQYAKAIISTYGGQLLSYQPHDQKEDLVFLSDKTSYQDGKAIRGGVPICWPWFGDDTSGHGRPSHGFARNQQWQIVQTKALTDGSTSVILSLTDTEESRSVWPRQFNLSLEIIIGNKLTVNLTTRNTGNWTVTISQALHTYLNISDIKDISISGLTDKDYLDKLDEFNLKQQIGDVVIDQEIDRIYPSAPCLVKLVDPGYKRTIKISSAGSHTTIVWNPWTEAITRIGDLDNDSYRHFVCIETANTTDNDLVRVLPNEQHTISAVYEIESEGSAL